MDTPTQRALSHAGEMRVFWGIVAQPFVVAAAAFVSFPVLLFGRNLRASGGALGIAVEAGVVALLVALLGALPTAVWLMKRRDVSLGEALLFGVGFGNVPFVVGTLLAGSYGVEGFARGAVFSSLLGAAGAAAFWAIAFRARLRESTIVAAPASGSGE